MASETTVVSDHSTAPEKVEKVNEGVKEIEERLPTSKGSGEQKEPKAEELPCQTSPTSSEVEEKIEEKKIEPSLTAEVKKPDYAPVLEVPVEDKSQPEAKPTVESVEEQPKEKPVIEVVEKQLEVAPEVVEVMEPPVVAEQPVTEPVEKKPQEQPPVEVVEKEAEVQPKIGNTPVPSVEAVEESEKVEVLPVKDSETLVAKDTDSSEEAPKKEEISEPITKVEDKLQEKSETVEVRQKECVETEPKESVEVEIVKDEETLTDKIEETNKEEPVVMDKPQEPSESAKKIEEECALIEPKESEKVEIAKVEETLAEKIEDSPLKDEKTGKDEVVATEKAPEQSEAAEKVEEECVVVEPEEDLKVEIADKEISADKIEDLLLKEEQTGKDEVFVTEKEPEQSEAAEKFEEVCAEVLPQESVKVDIAKFEEALVDKIEETTKVEPVLMESSDQITPTNVEAEADTKEDISTVVAENANIVEKEKESSETDVVELLSKEVVVESGKVELESEGKNVETEEEKKVVTEESDEPKKNKVEDVISSISPTEVAEKSLEGEISTRGIELFAENGKESIKAKSETVTSVETEKNGEVEEKIVEVLTPTVEVPAEEPKKSEKEVKGEETAETGETNYARENEAGEIAKPDFPTPEPPKEEVSTKPTSKQSKTIMSKVKQSLVKAKKAIIGKSPNSKTVSSEAKGNIKEK
ncbi:Serine/threonine-protein kinase kinX [Actinidia chinensis var. chinensis]|uniref:Serine/threonine-protein kinase kinX n=1 Tax=Actinidia chinensis var. chinensis TaxID=1590841 RepID=A0A2R6QIK4_ACTCC|nr:Serine/threonine-protein kinase kinX [Actinidia chinensis var. chinensis]